MNTELLPCPFCGGTEAFVERRDYVSAFVQCDSRVDEHSVCCARGPIEIQESDGEEVPGAANAIASWNRRGILAAVPAPAQQLEQGPVATVSQETYSSDGTSDIITKNLPIGTKLYTAPLAAPDVNQLVGALRLVTDCLSKALTGGEVRAKDAARALLAASELLEDYDKDHREQQS